MCEDFEVHVSVFKVCQFLLGGDEQSRVDATTSGELVGLPAGVSEGLGARGLGSLVSSCGEGARRVALMAEPVNGGL